MKAKVLFASAALAVLSLTSCGGSDTTIPSPTAPKTFADSVAMIQGTITGAQILEQYTMIPDSLRLSLDKEKYLQGMKLILSADTSREFQQGMLNALNILDGIAKARQAGIDINPDMVLAYFAETFRADSVDHAKLEKMSPEIGSVMSQFQDKMQEYQYVQQAKIQAELQKMFQRNVAEGKVFIEEQKKIDPELKTTESGLVYKITKQGDGPVAKNGQTVEVAYTGKLIDGTTFDSTDGNFVNFELNENLIPGFKEALTTFPSGTTAYIIIPQEIAYADQGSQGIEPGSTLVFEINIK